MRLTRRNYRQPTKKVKSNFVLCVQQLFTGEVHGYKITNKTIINILADNLIKLLASFPITDNDIRFPVTKGTKMKEMV